MDYMDCIDDCAARIAAMIGESPRANLDMWDEVADWVGAGFSDHGAPYMDAVEEGEDGSVSAIFADDDELALAWNDFCAGPTPETGWMLPQYLICGPGVNAPAFRRWLRECRDRPLLAKMASESNFMHQLADGLFGVSK